MRLTICLAAIAATLVAAAPASAKTVFGGIHAHRGGALSGGAPSNYENSLEAFKAAHAKGADVIELDSKLTSDNVPVIMHDQNLDRTTTCTGPVRQKTAAELAADCRVDTFGTDDNSRVGPAPVKIPTLAEVLAWAKTDKVQLNLEIKNQPTDADYDATPAFADTVLNTVEASGIPKSQVLIQSFWPPNLDRAEPKGFQTSMLVLSQVATVDNLRLAAPYDIVSPGWPVQGDPKEYVDAAHAMGKPVVPYTLDKGPEIAQALAAGVDGVITNDPLLGQKLVYGPACTQATEDEQKASRKYTAAKKKVKAAKTKSAKTKAQARAKKLRSAYLKAKKTRKANCAKAGQ